jgi:hypothetical protein
VYWHCSNVPYSKLSKKNGCVFIERRSLRGGHRLVIQGDSMPKLSLKQAVEHNLHKKPLPPSKEKASVYEIFAASTFPKAWCHAVHKAFDEGTTLIVGFNENCATYKFMRKSDHANLRTDACDILLENPDGSPGPGAFVAEATEGAKLLRVIVNRLREPGDEVAVRPTLPEGVCLSCPNSHMQPGLMRYGDPLAGEWVMKVTGACHACKPKTHESQIRLARMMPDKQLKTLSAQEGGKVLADCGIARIGYVNHYFATTDCCETETKAAAKAARVKTDEDAPGGASESQWFQSTEQVDEFLRNTYYQKDKERGLKAQLKPFKDMGMILSTMSQATVD